ncbi:MAG: type IV toxin-antitoxin system AbiEi family antitoxin domain-containing protein [Candidatus Hydrogenedentes bacterium]|nr:type IV toxin-antitoxin system AbiEi family antitoxin domain-containing protein [Candidatus Hydrogenedentota bacterium]
MATPRSLADKALAIALKQGVLRPRDLERNGVPSYYAATLFRAGRLNRVGRGLYVHPEAHVSENHTLALVAKRIPGSIICLLSALRFHELTTQLPNATWIAVSQKGRRPTANDIPLRIVRFSGNALKDGVREYALDGVTVRITDPARTVVDCFKYRNKIGRDVAVEALRDAMSQRKVNLQQLNQYARMCRVSKFMQPYLELYV